MLELIVSLLFPVIVLLIYVIIKRIQRIKITKEIVQNGGISEVRKVELLGIKQYIAIEGIDLDKPLCLFLHWSPRYPAPFGISSRGKYTELCEEVIGVYWDPPGKGKSSKDNIETIEKIQLEDFISIINELVDYLRKEFKREKVYIVGVGWGTILGMEMSKRYPEKIHGYIAYGQVINQAMAHKKAYELIIKNYEEKKYGVKINDLKHLGMPPYTTGKEYKKFLEIVEKNAYYQVKLSTTDTTTSESSVIMSIIYSPDYSLKDIIDSFKSCKVNYNHIAIEIQEKIDYSKEPIKLSVPVYFLHGKYDYKYPLDLLFEYYRKLEAPSKGMMILQNSSFKPIDIDIEKILKHTEIIVNTEFKQLTRLRKSD